MYTTNKPIISLDGNVPCKCITNPKEIDFVSGCILEFE